VHPRLGHVTAGRAPAAPPPASAAVAAGGERARRRVGFVGYGKIGSFLVGKVAAP
jgi:hypothetical protein